MIFGDGENTLPPPVAGFENQALEWGRPSEAAEAMAAGLIPLVRFAAIPMI